MRQRRLDGDGPSCPLNESGCAKPRFVVKRPLVYTDIAPISAQQRQPHRPQAGHTHRRPVRQGADTPWRHHHAAHRGQQRRGQRRQKPHLDPEAAGQPAQTDRQLDVMGTRVGVATRFCAFDSGGLADAVAAAEVLVSTIPAEVAAGYAGTLAAIPVLLDAIYDPWPTPLAAAVGSAGGRVISGLQMLLHQAFAQVEQFTGLPAPREAMTCALAALD